LLISKNHELSTATRQLPIWVMRAIAQTFTLKPVAVVEFLDRRLLLPGSQKLAGSDENADDANDGSHSPLIADPAQHHDRQYDDQSDDLKYEGSHLLRLLKDCGTD
jgi:hypothetical protein